MNGDSALEATMAGDRRDDNANHQDHDHATAMVVPAENGWISRLSMGAPWRGQHARGLGGDGQTWQDAHAPCAAVDREMCLLEVFHGSECLLAGIECHLDHAIAASECVG